MIINNNTRNNTSFSANVRTVGEIPEILNPAIAEMRKIFANIGTENDTVVFNIQECNTRSGLKKPVAWLRYVLPGDIKPDNRESASVGELVIKSDNLECASIGELVEKNEAHIYDDNAAEQIIKAANRLIKLLKN